MRMIVITVVIIILFLIRNHLLQLKRFLSDVPNPRFVGALGLISLVNVAPYDIPDWFPSVLLSLIPHLNAPQRISNFVRKVLQEFWLQLIVI